MSGRISAMLPDAFQDLVDWQCYGCGRLNEQGLQIKSRWDGDDVVCRWQAQPFHVGLPGRLQGGVIATAIICHAVWTATATACRDEGIDIAEPMDFAYSTTSLALEFLAPTAVDAVMTLRARVTALDRDGATVSCSVFVDDRETTRAQSEHRRVALPR
jgi:acyl-coenzyme A thioesterase PaaI-like protein